MHRGATKTQNDLIKLQFALPADEWIIQLVPEGENGRPIRDFIPKRKLFSAEQVSWFRARNADEYHIYGRPNSTRYVLLDLDKDGEAVVQQMRMDKFALSALVETSAGKFQAWIAVSREDLPVPVATALGKVIAKRYNGDKGSTDALHVGRLPGLRNKKLQYRSGPGDGGPLVLLRVARQGPMIPDGMDELIRDAGRFADTQVLPPPSAPSGAPVFPNHTAGNIDIDPSRSPMTPYEAREFYDAEVQRLAELFDWHLPICKGDRSEVDYHVARGLYVQYGFDSDDIAAVLVFASAKAEEKGLHALDYVKSTVTSALRRRR